jgi:hypothetical protein
MRTPDPVFNEPSVAPPAQASATARSRMAGVIDLLVRAPEHNLGSSLRISEQFYLLELASTYTANDWIQDGDVERDHLNFFLSLAARSPFIRIQDGEALSRIEDSEVTCHGITHLSFLAAYALDSVLVSFNQVPWSKPDLPAIITRLDGNAALLSEAITLVNLSTPTHYNHHAGWFARGRAVTSPSDLWSRRAELFPNLRFCPSVEDQLHSQAPILRLIIARLNDLQRVAALNTPFSKDSFQTECSPTSSETLNHKKFGPHYDFSGPDGSGITCGWHLYLPDGKRIYFAADYTIGHIGAHLPTVKFH